MTSKYGTSLMLYASAESDCSLALTMDDHYLKAYLRRGTARLKLGKTEEAREDFQTALKLEPGNKLARAEIDKLNKEREKKFVRPVKRPPHLRSKKPLKRITIEDRGEIPSDQPSPDSQQLTTPPNPAPQITLTTSSPQTTNSQTQQSIVQTPATSQTTDTVQSTTPQLTTPPPLSKIQVLSSEQEAIASSHDPLSKIKVVSTEKEEQTKEPTKSGVGVVGVVKLSSVPENSIPLQADWKRVRRDRKVLGEYFKTLPVSQFPTLLQQSLETGIFSDILTILLEDYLGCGRSCLSELQALTRVKRFSVTLMFLSSTDKQKLKVIFLTLKRQFLETKKQNC